MNRVLDVLVAPPQDEYGHTKGGNAGGDEGILGFQGPKRAKMKQSFWLACSEVVKG